jgi:hypothetical protein
MKNTKDCFPAGVYTYIGKDPPPPRGNIIPCNFGEKYEKEEDKKEENVKEKGEKERSS